GLLKWWSLLGPYMSGRGASGLETVSGETVRFRAVPPRLDSRRPGTHRLTISPHPSSCLALGQLFRNRGPVVAGDTAAQVERAVERLHGLGIEIGDLPVVEDADIIEALLELDVDTGQALEVIRLAARSEEHTSELQSRQY